LSDQKPEAIRHKYCADTKHHEENDEPKWSKTVPWTRVRAGNGFRNGWRWERSRSTHDKPGMVARLGKKKRDVFAGRSIGAFPWCFAGLIQDKFMGHAGRNYWIVSDFRRDGAGDLPVIRASLYPATPQRGICERPLGSVHEISVLLG
jgi:hypothetical protein